MKKHLLFFFVILLFLPVVSWGQTNPTVQSLPYSQNFNSLTGASPAYPSGWQGWTISGSLGTSYSTASPNGDQAIAVVTNTSTSSHVGDFIGKLGILSTSSAIKAICLSINTSSFLSIQVSFDANTQRTENTRQNELGLQYRLGTSGTFTNVSSSTYQNQMTPTNTAGTGAVNTQSISVTLPSECNNSAVVQLRWIIRDVSGSGNRPGFSIDNISVTGTALTATAAQLLSGIATSPLSGGNVNKAVLGFSLTSNATQTFTAINVQTSSTTVGKLSNLKFYKSTDNNYSTSGDNTQISGVSVVQTATEIQLSGFTEALSTTTKNFFITADIDLSVTTLTPNVQPSFDQSNFTVSAGTKANVTITGTDYSFQPPAILLAAIEGAYAYTEDVGEIFITTTTTIAAIAANLVSGVIQIIGNYQNGEDILSFTNANEITGNWDATNGKLTLSGTSSVANYEAALRSVKYQNISQNPSILQRTVSISFSDGTDESNTLTRNISITAVNDAPALSGIEITSINYIEGDLPTQITGSLTLSDVDNTTMASAVVQITGNYTNGEDVLSFTNQNGITGAWIAGSGTLNLSGAATVSNYQTALRSVKYQNTSQNPATVLRTVSFTVNDGALNSNTVTRTITVTSVNNAPRLASIEGTKLSYFKGDPPTIITNTILVNDPDNANLVSAEVQITGFYQNGIDVLSFTNANGISGNWDVANGTLSLSGAASLSNYQAALRSITYHNTSTSPLKMLRKVTFKVNDGLTNSNISTREIDLGKTPPILGEIETDTLVYKQGDIPIKVTNSVTVLGEGLYGLEFAIVQITGNYKNGEDLLILESPSQITKNWVSNSGTLILYLSSVWDYEAIIRNVKYQNTSNSPSNLPRTISITVQDENSTSNTVTRVIKVILKKTVLLSTNNSKGGTTIGEGSFYEGSSITVTAIPNAGYNFVNWTEGGSVISTNPSYTFTVSGNRNLVANFALIQYTVAVQSNTVEGGTTTGGGAFYYGNSVTVKALPSAGYDFANWTENSSIVSDSLNYTFLVNGNRNLVANFTTMRILSVLPEIINANSSKGTTSIFVYNSGGGNMKWNAVSNVFWITIISEASGTNNGELKISYSPNNSISRIGTIIISADGVIGSPKTVEVRQAGRLTNVEDLNLGIPDTYQVEQNYPNPFNPSTIIRYGLPKESNVSLTVYNILGEEVARLFDGIQSAGFHEINFNATNLSSGIYIYKIYAGNPSSGSGRGFTQIKKMLLMK